MEAKRTTDSLAVIFSTILLTPAFVATSPCTLRKHLEIRSAVTYGEDLPNHLPSLTSSLTDLLRSGFQYFSSSASNVNFGAVRHEALGDS